MKAKIQAKLKVSKHFQNGTFKNLRNSKGNIEVKVLSKEIEKLSSINSESTPVTFPICTSTKIKNMNPDLIKISNPHISLKQIKSGEAELPNAMKSSMSLKAASILPNYMLRNQSMESN